MRFLKLYIFIICSISYTTNIKAQLGELFLKLKTCSSKDSAEILNYISQKYRFTNGDSAMYYAEKALQIAKKNNDFVEQGDAESNIGVQYHLKAKYEKATTHYLNALKIFESHNYLKGIAPTYQNIGILYQYQGNLKLATKYALQAAEIYKKLKHKKGEAGIYNNLATIYSEQKDVLKSLEYHLLALQIREEIKDSSGIATSYNGIAIAYSDLNEYQKAIDYNLKSIEINERLKDYKGLATSYNNIAGCYKDIKQTDKAIEYYLRGIEIANINTDYYALSDLYISLSATYESVQKYKEALEMRVLYDRVKDTLYKTESMEKVLEMETQYQSDKKELQIKNQALEIESKEKQNQQKNYIIIIGAVALFITVFLAYIAYRNFQKTKKQNLIIENQKQQVELKNEEIVHQKELVDEKATELAVKQKEIIDSINYAKRIQQAVLTGEEVWNKISPEHFILFMPKDIVSGDFYWAYHTPNNRSIFVLADCTGHGVPGGFMSMLGNSFLNEIIVEGKIFKADEILNKLRAKIISALEQKGATEQKDGMDMALCVWNKLDNTLEFAGANNPLWLVRSNELIEYKANKMPIGTYTEDNKPFTSVTINLQKGDTLYLTTDGYADQFGGEKGKKLKYKPLIEHLLKINHQDMPQQKQLLEKLFLDWRGKYDQIDDVSVIGIRV